MQNKLEALGIPRMSIEVDKPGFMFPPVARKYGFMDPVNTMQEIQPCECRSFSNGVATGVGVVLGVSLAAGTLWGISRILKR